MTYYGIVGKGRKWIEVRVTKEPGKPLSQVETGEWWTDAKEAAAVIEAKNLAISRERYGR